MKHLLEFRDPDAAQAIASRIAARVTRPWTLMEVCGGQTHAILRFGIDQILPHKIELIHGPGCPVCVTPIEVIDRAIAIAARPEVTLCSFGDMLRVPGTHESLLAVKSRGADVRVIYSPLDALRLAQLLPHRQVVLLAIGFETTAPANALAIRQAARLGLQNFSALVSQVLVPPAMEAILQSADCRVDAFLAAGHVCSVMGLNAYIPLAATYRVPIVVTGFEPLDLLAGIEAAVRQLEAGEAHVENAYRRAVNDEGNRAAQAVLNDVFALTDRRWRGMGVIPDSGWQISQKYRRFDADERFDATAVRSAESPLCRSGEVLRGAIKPAECQAFGTLCTPENPLGATMVSSEGACAAHFRFREANS
jgi:hydrogenase expression/formation protein HypD